MVARTLFSLFVVVSDLCLLFVCLVPLKGEDQCM